MLDDPLVSNLVFYPRQHDIPSNLPSHIQTLQFQISEEITIGGLCFIKDRNLPTLLMFHGNGETAMDYTNLYQLFFDCNLNLAVIDYRGYGFSSGRPYYSSLFSDALPIYDHFVTWMEENRFIDSVFVMGRSLGSTCASEIGRNNPPELKGIFFESAFASVYNLMTNLFGIRHESITPQVLKEYSNDTRMVNITKPVLILHGTRDQLIPFSEAKLIQQALPEDTEATLVAIEGAGHNDMFSHIIEYTTPLKEFVAKNK
ncbi:MAG: alpha/beta hydrolase [Candidatus Kariarchaeaceae archaeon]|jgi:pimeloyl-ACP methyl ester carboxylesterase